MSEDSARKNSPDPARADGSDDTEDFAVRNQTEVTQLLAEMQQFPELFDRVVPLVYEDFKRIGRAQRRRLGGSHTLQTTALVHEVFIRLRGDAGRKIHDRRHFRRLAALAMRQIMLDHARRKCAEKRGSAIEPENLNDEVHGRRDADMDLVINVEKILQDMSTSHPRMAEILAAKMFASYTNEEIAEMLSLSTRSVSRELQRGRAWLKTELGDQFQAE